VALKTRYLRGIGCTLMIRLVIWFRHGLLFAQSGMSGSNAALFVTKSHFHLAEGQPKTSVPLEGVTFVS
jgi:hypothetical protein